MICIGIEMKKIKGMIIFCLCMLVMLGVVDREQNIYAVSIPQERQEDRLVDLAGVIGDEKESKLKSKLDSISEEWNCDVAIVFVESLQGKDVTAYADDFYDYNGYGMGTDDSGILLLISRGDREWAISTYGKGIKVFTDKEQSYIMDRVQPELKNNDYYNAGSTFASLCEESLELYDKTGKGHDTRNFLKAFWYCCVFSGVVALLCIIGMIGKLKTVKFQKGARDYVKRGSMHITSQKDLFLYRNVTKTVKQTSSGSSGSSGSSTHRSSSGRSHGGSRGKF